jgi:hypothetical protein
VADDGSAGRRQEGFAGTFGKDESLTSEQMFYCLFRYMKMFRSGRPNSETAIPTRESASFESRLRSADSGGCLMITNDLERAEKMGGKEIRYVPLALFLLSLW